MYKLDVKGYKKDLKAANAKIESLERALRPETPDSRTGRETHARRPSSDDSDQPRPSTKSSSGPGILWPQRSSLAPNTNTVDAHTSLPHPSGTSRTPPSVSPLASPPRQRTPLSIHKKLPKPPPRTPSPRLDMSSPRTASPPVRSLQIQRAETLRSLSESIISSYAKRGTPEHNDGDFPPLPARGRSSDPVRHEVAVRSDDTMVPMSRFSSEMLRTPGLGPRAGLTT